MFPCIPGQKEPACKDGVLAATTNPETIRQWWRDMPAANVAVNAGAAGLMVIDLDPDPAVPGLRTSDQVLAALRRSLPELPDTLVRSRTPRGGEHLFYALDSNERVPPSSKKLGDGVDVRSHHSYVVLPPSHTSDGIYQWTGHPDFAKPAYRHDEMVRRASVARDRRADAHQWIIAADLPENVDRAIKWLRGEEELAGQLAKVAVMGKGGEATALATAAMCRSFGLSEDTTRELMLEHWNPRCEPPWGDSELAHFEAKVANAYEYATSAPGNVTGAYQAAKRGMVAQTFTASVAAPQAVPGPSQEAPRSTLPDGLYDGPEYGDREPPRYIVEGVLQECSYSVASGRSQAGKSFCELALALSVAMGRPWFGRPVLVTGPVLYVAAEGQGRIWRDTVAWCEQEGIDPQTTKGRFFIYDRSIRLDDEAGMATLGEVWQAIAVRAGESPIYAVFDTLRKNMRGGVADEKDAAKVLEAVEHLQLGRAAVTLVAHHGKSGDDTKGVTDWQDNADQVRLYTGRVQDRTTTLTFGKIKSAEDGFSTAIKFVARNDTLVATAVLPQTNATAVQTSPPPSNQPNQPKPQGKVKAATLDAVNLEIPRILSSANSGHEWSDGKLASELEVRLALGITASQIRQHYLPAIRANAHCMARQLWRVNEGAKPGTSNGVWRMSPHAKATA